MKPIIFTLRQEPQQRLDLSPLTPDRLVRRSAKEIESIEIGTTRVSVKVGDEVLFSKYGYDEIKIGGVEYYILSESSVLAILN